MKVGIGERIVGGRRKLRLIPCFVAFLLFSLLLPTRAYPQRTAFVDGGSVAIGTGATTLATLSTTFPAGNNFVIAIVQIDNPGSNDVSRP